MEAAKKASLLSTNCCCIALRGLFSKPAVVAKSEKMSRWQTKLGVYKITTTLKWSIKLLTDPWGQITPSSMNNSGLDNETTIKNLWWISFCPGWGQRRYRWRRNMRWEMLLKGPREMTKDEGHTLLRGIVIRLPSNFHSPSTSHRLYLDPFTLPQVPLECQTISPRFVSSTWREQRKEMTSWIKRAKNESVSRRSIKSIRRFT